MPQYTGVVLLPDEQQYLLSVLAPLYSYFKTAGFVNRNNQGQLLCHHMTCHLGGAKDEERPHLDQKFDLTVDAWGANDKAMALRVSSVSPNCVASCNATPHVTAMVNPTAGGSPRHSNDITVWYPMKPLTVVGVFREV